MRRLAIMSVLAVALAGALVVAPSQTKPAEATVFTSGHFWAARQAFMQASSNLPMWGYNIDMLLACRQQRGAWSFATAWSRTNPYSWACYRVTSWYPYQVAYLGGVDLNRYCRENHPGTWAVLGVPGGAYDWFCASGLA
jgi:hypothetical protein